MVRPQDEYPFDRAARSLIWRVGTIAAVSGDGKRLTVTLPGGALTNVMVLTSVTNVAVGASVVVVFDRGNAVAIGNPK